MPGHYGTKKGAKKSAKGKMGAKGKKGRKCK